MNLTQAMREQRQALDSLDALIIEERAHLLAPVPGDLVIVLEHKDAALERVGQAARLVKTALQAAGLPGDDSVDLSNRLNALDPGLADAWRALREAMARTRERNALNGQLIAQRLQFTTARLDALRGATHRAGVYDQRGQRGDAQATGRMIAAA